MFLVDFVVSPPGCGRSVTDFWGWDAHEAQLRCPDEVDGDMWSTRRGLNLSPTKLSRPWSPWESSPLRKTPHDRAGKRTRDLMISSQKLWPLDHEASHVKIQSLANVAAYVWVCVVCRFAAYRQAHHTHLTRTWITYAATFTDDYI
jgi:hypothetical protein